jgi:hypothetical protein
MHISPMSSHVVMIQKEGIPDHYSTDEYRIMRKINKVPYRNELNNNRFVTASFFNYRVLILRFFSHRD